MSRPLAAFTPELTALSACRKPLLQLDLHVVTPLFGGGAIAREVDRERPVNAKSVRGHLRFWWRACRGAQFANPQKLFEAEAKIWGSTELPASVEVEIEILNAGSEWQYDDAQVNGRRVVGWKTSLPRYALFPFQPQHAPWKPAVPCLKGVEFRLRLTAPEMHRADVEAAAWAWIMFGGVGARTRRGCGTLFCSQEGFQPSPDALLTGWTRHGASNPYRLRIPALQGAKIVLRQNHVAPMDAWRASVAVMQELRQGVGVGRPPGPSRSFWPEPDSIKDATSVWLKPYHKPAHLARPFYPRADLGLPIVFKFKHDDDPPQQTLQAQGDKMTRMASPIILKALPLTKTTAVSMVLLLNAPHVWDLDTPSVGFGGVALPPTELNDPAKSANVPPMRGKATAREAFMDFAKSKWSGKEITLP